MPIIMNGRYAYAEPGSGLTVLSMDGGEIDLFGAYTSIKTTVCDTFSKIGDFLVEKAVEHPETFQLVLGVAVTALLAGLAVAAISAATAATGGLALVALGTIASGCVGAAIGTGLYTVGTFAHDKVTGYNRSNEDYKSGLLAWGTTGFTAGASAYLTIASFPAGPALALEGGGIASGAGAAAASIPVILTNVAEKVLVVDGVVGAAALLSAALGGNGGGQGEDKEGVHFEEGEGGSNFKGQTYKGERNPEIDFVNSKGKSTLTKHAGKHGYASPEEYLKDARNFLEKEPTSTTQSFVSSEGTYFRYDTATNEFGIINQYGGISTYFKPEEGMTYWLEQIVKYAPKSI